MTTEDLKHIYPATLEPLDAGALDVYLSDIPLVDVFNTPAEIVKAPGTVAERLARVLEAARTIETSRNLISYHGTALKRALEQDPELLAHIPEEQRAQVLELVRRIEDQGDTDQPVELREPVDTEG